MIMTNKLIGIMAENGISQSEMARRIGIAPKTFYEKMSKGVFGSDEIEIMVRELNIKNPWDIFFANVVTSKVIKADGAGDQKAV